MKTKNPSALIAPPFIAPPTSIGPDQVNRNSVDAAAQSWRIESKFQADALESFSPTRSVVELTKR